MTLALQSISILLISVTLVEPEATRSYMCDVMGAGLVKQFLTEVLKRLSSRDSGPYTETLIMAHSSKRF